jgi:hypothetical protein
MKTGISRRHFHAAPAGLETPAGLRHDCDGTSRCASLRRRPHDICWDLTRRAAVERSLV